MLRCIHCCRSDNQITLSNSFECIDTISCDAATALRKAKPCVVALYSDCAIRYSDNSLGIGLYCTIDGVHSEQYSGYKYIGTGTVPEGEMTGIAYAFRVAVLMSKAIPKSTYLIFNDAQAMVKVVNEEYKCSPQFKANFNTIKKCQKTLGIRYLGLQWIRRELNKEADILSKKALEYIQ